MSADTDRLPPRGVVRGELDPLPGEHVQAGSPRHIVSLPPRDFMPEGVLSQYDAYRQAVEAWSEIATRIGNREGELATADDQDRAAVLTAVRAGHSTEHLGTVARDAVEREQRMLGHREAAAAQVAFEALRLLVARLAEVRDLAVDALAEEIEAIGDEYAEAASAMLNARRRYRWLRDRRAWWSAIGGTRMPHWPPAGTEGIELAHHGLLELVHEVRNAALTDTGRVMAYDDRRR